MSLRRNTIWNLAGSGLPLIAAAAFIPYVLRQLGNEAFGVLTLIWALIGYFSLFDLGVGRALTYEMSKLRAANTPAEIPPTLKAGLLLTAAAGMLGMLIMLVLAPWLAQSWLKISPSWQPDAQLAFQIAAAGVVATTITSGLRGALEGLERFAESNLSKIFLGFCMFVLPALSVWLHGPTLWIIALYLVGARVLVMVGSALLLRSHLLGSGPRLTSRYLQPLLSYGVWVTVTGIVGPLMVYGDRFFVSATVGAAQLPLYAIPQEGLQRLFLIPAALCGALLPQLASLQGIDIKNVYRRNYKRVAVIMLGLCALAALSSYPVLAIWLSPEFAQKALPIALILATGIWLNAMALVPYTLLHARGKPKITALFHMVELVFYIVALYYLASQMGLVGAALAWVLRVLLDLILLHVAANWIIRRTNDNC
jgi:O-antigen/teichoic acid export membrane protein